MNKLEELLERLQREGRITTLTEEQTQALHDRLSAARRLGGAFQFV